MCGCSAPLDTHSDSNEGSSDSNVTLNGTVIDLNQGVRGIIEMPAGGPVVLKMNHPNRIIRVELEEGIAGALAGVADGNAVYVVVRATSAPVEDAKGEISLRATCFLVMNFGGSFYQGLISAISAADDALTLTLQRAVTAAISAGSESALSPACVIATIKALAKPGVKDKIIELAGEGYIIYDVDCVPSPAPGVINVILRFRNFYGQERAFVVPVSLRTWIETTPMDNTDGVSGDPLIEVSPKKYCSFKCQACRVACRTAQAACIGICPGSGPAAILCAAACVVAGDECYNRC